MKRTVRAIAFLLVAQCFILRAGDVPDSAQTRSAFLKIVDRPRVPLAPEVTDLPNVGDLLQQHFTYASDAENRVPGILLKQSTVEGRRPVIIICHGTGGKKEGQLGLMKRLCEKGFIGVAIDGRFHGERCKAGTGDVEYCAAIAAAYKSETGHPLYYDTVWDLMRLIDYLETRADVDPKRIGLIGFSKGGIETFLTSGLEPRVAVSVPCIGVQSFKWGLANGGWKSRLGTFGKAVSAINKDEGSELNVEFARKFYDRTLPGIYTQFDGPAMLTSIAPRPLLVINGDSDDKTPLPSVMEAAAAAKTAYHAANADDKFVQIVEEKTGHSVNAEAQSAIVAWFVKWLVP